MWVLKHNDYFPVYLREIYYEDYNSRECYPDVVEEISKAKIFISRSEVITYKKFLENEVCSGWFICEVDIKERTYNSIK